MGVYINMEMPINCEKCIYSAWSNFYQIYTCNAIRKNEPVIFDEKQVMSTAIVRSRRADNCPLVPVPPHGDLIDRNPFIEFIKTHWDSYDQWFVEQLEARPTIIPAEEGET